jgi:hypothetical protein
MNGNDRVRAFVEGWLHAYRVQARWRLWWRIVRIIRRGPEQQTQKGIEAADRLFWNDQMYRQAMTALAHRDNDDKPLWMRFMLKKNRLPIGRCS